jgi:hypothetical protein
MVEAAATVSADVMHHVVPLLGISHSFTFSTSEEPQKGHFMAGVYV